MDQTHNIRIDVSGSADGFKPTAAEVQRELDSIRDAAIGANAGVRDLAGDALSQATGMGRGFAGVLTALPPLLGVAVAGIGALGAAFIKGAHESEALQKSMILTGNAAGTTFSELSDMARSIADVTGATQAAVSGALVAFVSTGKVGGDALAMVTDAAIRMERAGGQSIAESVKQFESLGKGPVEASIKLNEQTNFLTAAIFEQVKSLSDQGKESEAAALAMTAYANAMADRAGEIAGNIGTIERAWLGLKDVAKGAWDAMLGIGRAESLSDRLQAAKEKFANGGGDDAEHEVWALQIAVDAEKNRAKAKAESNQQEAAGIKWLQDGDKLMSRKQQMEREIIATRNLGVEAGKSELEIEQRIAAIRDKYSSKAKTAAKKDPLDADLESMRRDAKAQEVGLDSSTLKSMEKLDALLAKGKISAGEYSDLIDVVLNKDSVLRKEQEGADKANALLDQYRRVDQVSADRIKREAELAQMTERQRVVAQAAYKVEDEWARRREEIIKQIPEGVDRTRALAEANAEMADQVERVRMASEASYDSMNAFGFGADRAFRRYSDSAGNAAAGAEQLFSKALSGMEDAMTRFVQTGKMDFKSLADSMIAEIIRIQVRAAMAKATEGFSLWSIIGGAGKSGGTPAPTGSSDVMSVSTVGVAHGGAEVGSWTTGSRSVPMSVFAGAPRAHTGVDLASDERPYILQTGERVLSRAENAASKAGGLFQPVLNFIIKNESGQQLTATGSAIRNESSGFDFQMIVSQVVTSDLSRNGPIAKGILGMTGARRAV